MSRWRLGVVVVLVALAGTILWTKLPRRAVSEAPGASDPSDPRGRPSSHSASESDPLDSAAVLSRTVLERDRAEIQRARLRGRVESRGSPVAAALVRWISLEKEDTEPTPAWPWADWGVPVR